MTDTTKPRTYGKWAGNPNGTPQDKNHCIKGVVTPGTWIEHQCTRNRGHGPEGKYCKLHARIIARHEARKKKVR